MPDPSSSASSIETTRTELPPGSPGAPPEPIPAEPMPAELIRPRRSGSVPPASFWKALGMHILIPFFLAAGMGLAYLGAFHAPEPNHLSLGVVGTGISAEAFTQQLNDAEPGKLDARVVPDAETARQLITAREVSAAYEPGADDATLYISSAASATTAEIAQKIFLPIAYEQQLPLKIVDVVPSNENDATSQGLFFLLVGMSVGGYSSAVAISAVAARISVLWRAAVTAASSAVIAGLGIVIAGPVYGILEHSLLSLWLLSWLYVMTIALLGIALHPVLRKWTTPILTMLFVMLNFTSSGGIFTSETLPPFFSGLGTFWNGAAWLNAAQGITYFPGQALGADLLKLVLWLAAGALLLFLTHVWSIRRTRLADELARVREDEEGIAA